MTARLAITALLGYALSFGALTANAAENNGTFADVSYDLEPNCAEWKHEFCLAVNTGGPTKEKKDPARGDAKRFDLSALRILADASDGDASGVSDELRGEVRDVIIATAKETNTPLVAEPVASEIVRRWEEFIDSDEIGFLIKGSEVAVFGIGATIRNVVDKSHSEGIFTADVHVTITIAPNRTGRIYDDLDDAASENHVPLLSSFVASRRDEGPAYVKLLKDEYRNVFGEDVDRAASIPIRDGRCTEAFRKEQRLLTMDEYEDLLGKSNLEILASKDAQLAPVTDGKGNLASLLAEEVVIEFEPLNTQFYPFQREHLDFNLFIPPLVSTGLDVRKQNFYCINSHTSGFTTTLKRKSEASRRDFFLSLIPYVSSVRTDEPWLNRSPFYLKGMHPGFSPVVQNVGIPGSRIVRTASFRILWNDRDVSGWMMLVPFLFAVLMIQLQWLMLSAASCGTSTMIAGILLAQTIYMSQNVQFGNFGVWSNPSSAEVLGENNVVTSVIFLAYGIAGLYVSTIAMMAFINNAKGKYAWLHRHQIQIFNYLRLFGLLLTPLYIPILAIYSDPETGYQHGYDWLWYLVGLLCAGIFVSVVAIDCVRRKLKQRNENLDIDDKSSLGSLLKSPPASWSVEDVGRWIRESQYMQTQSGFKEDELNMLAEKFKKAKIDGEAFLHVLASTDSETLTKVVGIEYGDAFRFCKIPEGALKNDACTDLEMDALPKTHDTTTTTLAMNSSDESFSVNNGVKAE